MKRFFVPYCGAKPAAITVNGHRLVILSREKTAFEDELEVMGADSIKLMQSGDSPEEETVALNRLAKSSNAGVVVAPVDAHLREVIKNLETQLPWLH